MENKDPIIANIRTGKQDNSYIEINEPLIIDNSGMVQLNEYPFRYNRVVVTGENKDWYETEKDIPNENEYRVDYEHKVVYFNIANIGKQLNFKYTGMGNSFFPASSIYVERDGLTVIETLDTLTKTTAEVRDHAQEAAEIALEAAGTIDEAVAKADDLAQNTKYTDPYDSAMEYKRNNIVSFGGSSFMAKQSTQGNPPPDPLVASDNEYWGLVGRKGADGTGTVKTRKEKFIATEGQTVFNLQYTYDQFQDRTSVFVGGVSQVYPDNYEETSDRSITLSEGVPEGTEVIIEYFSESVPLASDIQTTVDNHTNVINDHTSRINENSNKIGVLSELETIDKTNLVKAINENLEHFAQLNLNKADKVDLESTNQTLREDRETLNNYIESNDLKISTLVPKRHIFGGQLAEMKNALANPLAQFVGIVFIGDSITWGRTLVNNGVYEPRNGTLSDPRDVFTTPSFVNEFKRYIGKEYAYGSEPVLSNWVDSPSGEAIAEYSIEHILYPKNGDFNLVTTGANMTVNEIASGGSITGMQMQLTDNQYDGTGNHSIKFKFTGDTLTLSFAIVAGEKGYYELIVDGQKIGTYQNAVGIDGFTAGNDKRRTHTFPFVRDKEIEIKTTRNNEPSGWQRIRIEGMVVNKIIRITNQGIIGATVNSYRKLISSAVTSKDSFVICQLGTNDRIIESGKPKGSNVLRANLQYLLSSLTGKSVILMAANPAANNDPAVYSFTMQDVRDVVFRVARANNIDMVDNYAIFSELDNAIYTADGLHPNEIGQPIIGGNIINSMEF